MLDSEFFTATVGVPSECRNFHTKLMESTFHLASELGNVMDASCTSVLPMSRMHGFRQLDLGSIEVLPLD